MRVRSGIAEKCAARGFSTRCIGRRPDRRRFRRRAAPAGLARSGRFRARSRRQEHRDRGGRDALDDRPHAVGTSGSTVARFRSTAWSAAVGRRCRRSSPGGFSRVSSRCRGATLASALSIDCFTPGMLTLELRGAAAWSRWRCRLRSPHAGQQQPMIGSSHCLVYGARFVLADVHQRPNHDMRAIVGDQLGRHGLERAGEEQVEQQRFDEVVGMMAERDLGRADLRGDPVQHAAPQPRAQRARRLVGVEDVLDQPRRCRCARCGTPSRAPRRSSRSDRACIPCSRNRR